MLIEFSVSNFRSFRERQTFSMVAAPRLKSRGNVFNPLVKGEKLPPLLKIAAIYGPNASGKSNLLKALNVVKTIVGAKPSTFSSLPVSAFRFDPDLKTVASSFEIHFVTEGRRYQFNLSATAERITEERLTDYPNGKATILYERRFSEKDGESYTFSKDDLQGGADVHQMWRKLTGPRTAFISQAVANSSEDINQLNAPFDWLSGGIIMVDDGMAGLARMAKKLIKDGEGHAADLSRFLQEVDVPVTSIRVDQISSPTTLNALAFGANQEKSSVNYVGAATKTTLTHTTALGQADFDFDEESAGTRGLFGFWMPWGILEYEKRSFHVVAVDELDSSLHPEIVANLVQKYLTFSQPSQLIFSTHDTHLMNTKLLRRDQFWLTERDKNGATQLRSIHDFDGRESEDVEKRYYEGRYRGLPIVRKS